MNTQAAPLVESLIAALPRALPAWAYSHPEMTRLEFERILKPSWQIVCHVSSIPRPGDYLTLDLGSDSVVARTGPASALSRRAVGTSTIPANLR